MEPQQKINKLTFIKEAQPRTVPSGASRRMGLFLCECGVEKEIAISMVKRGVTKACGCVSRQQIKALGLLKGKVRGNYKHGLFGTDFYNKYHSLLQRCRGNVPHYSLNGIKSEFEDFGHFKRAMYKPYLNHVQKHGKRQTTIDRIDSTGNYSPENCRWATYTVQARNRSNNTLITINGVTKVLAVWIDELKLTNRQVKKLVARKRNEIPRMDTPTAQKGA